MSESRDAVQLRAALSRYRQQKRYGRYPSELSERAVVYARERSRAGALAAEIAAELGVHEATADRWTSGREQSAESPMPSISSTPSTPKAVASLPFVPVLVRPSPRDAPSMRLKLAFPDGTRMQVSGIAGRDLAEAIEALRRTR
jgi:predicted transcriptional regulator